jgi:cellulose synthase operon protein C
VALRTGPKDPSRPTRNLWRRCPGVYTPLRKARYTCQVTRTSHRLLSFALGLMFCATAGAQDFDPKGRKRPGGGRPPTQGGTARPPAGGGARPKPPTGQPVPPAGGDMPQRPPGAAPTVLIERYTRVVLAQPGSPFPLQRLAQLYRDRDGNIAQLVKDFEARTAADGETYPAWISLGGVYKIDGRGDDAVKAYEKAIALKPKEAPALLALARLLQDRADLPAARTRYEQALELQTVASDREQTLRALLSLLFDQKDYDAAKAVHDKLVVIAKGSLFVRSEFARELLARGEFARAETEYAALIPLAAGDNRVLAPALKDLGRAQVKGGKTKEALVTLKRALASAGREAGVRSEVYELIAEVHRKEQTLLALIAELEREGANDFPRLVLLGNLYEETGDGSKALLTYKKALAQNPKHLDLRLKVVRILQSQGEIDKAITEYESLVRAAPNNPTFVFELAEAILQRGDRGRAMRLLTEVEGRSGSDEEILSRLADFYGRIGESEKSVAALTKLSQLNTNDPSHIVDLGSRYFQDGKTQLAMQTWRRMLTVVQPRARALSSLGDVLLEHEMSEEAIALFKEAISLDRENPLYKKQLAGAYERTKAYAEAKALWEQVAKKAKDTDDRLLAREVRTRMIAIWGFEKTLQTQLQPLRARFNATPPDLDAGRLLAEVELRLKNPAGAEATMRRVIKLAPSDTETYLALERLLVQSGRSVDAIPLLEQLIAADPKRARDTYQRMGEYAQQNGKDRDAIRFGQRAVELNPDDAEAHRKLADLYYKVQERERAIVEYKAALAKNDRLFIVYFQLADLLMAKGESTEADTLLRRVLKTAPDDELVGRAARQSLLIHLGKGTLEELERDLLPLTVGNPTRPVFRRVLVDLYGSLTFALVKRARSNDAEGEAASKKLSDIGMRAIKPLLDALADTDVGQQRIAVDVLSQVGNRNTGLSLAAYAVGPADPSLRARAMVACANLKDPSLLPKFEAVLFPKDVESGASSDQVSVATAYAVAKLGTARATPLLLRVLRDGTPEMQTFAVLGLGALRERSSKEALQAIIKTPSKGALLRAATTLSLASIGADESAALEMTSTARPALRRSGALALGMSEAALRNPKSVEAVAAALFNSASVRYASDVDDAAARTLGALTAGRVERIDLLPRYEQGQDLENYIMSIGAGRAPAVNRTLALIKYEAAIAKAAAFAARTSPERAVALIDAFGTRQGALAPFIATSELASADAKAKETAVRIAAGLEDTVMLMARAPDSNTRARALDFMARSNSDAAVQTLKSALTDKDEAVVRTALSAIAAAQGPAPLTEDVTQLAASHQAWTVRVLAIDALGALLRTSKANAHVLTKIAGSDPYPVIRERALRELLRTDAALARQAANAALRDADSHVREVAAAIAQGKAP